jgi:hypothetical protein
MGEVPLYSLESGGEGDAPVLNFRTTTAQKCEAVPKRGRIHAS